MARNSPPFYVRLLAGLVRPFPNVDFGLILPMRLKVSLPTTPGLDVEPWRIAAGYLEDLEVDERFFGWMFIAAGTFYDPPRSATTRRAAK